MPKTIKNVFLFKNPTVENFIKIFNKYKETASFQELVDFAHLYMLNFDLQKNTNEILNNEYAEYNKILKDQGITLSDPDGTTFPELINVAKQKLIETALEKNEKNEELFPDDPNSESQKACNYFLNYNSSTPYTYSQTLNDHPVYSDTDSRALSYLSENQATISYQLEQNEERFKQIQKDFTTNYLRRLNVNELGNAKTNTRGLLNKTKGGIFERLFRRTSPQFKNFQQKLENFENTNVPEDIRKDQLREAAKAYLRYKLPNFKGFNTVKPEDLNGLSTTSKNRVNQCLDVLKSMKEQEKIDIINQKVENKDIGIIQALRMSNRSPIEKLQYDVIDEPVNNNKIIFASEEISNDKEIDNQFDDNESELNNNI